MCVLFISNCFLCHARPGSNIISSDFESISSVRLLLGFKRNGFRLRKVGLCDLLEGEG